MIANFENRRTLTKARNIYCRMRADEIMFSPALKLEAFLRAAAENPARTARLFDRLTMDGCISTLLDMEDLLRKTAEQMADEQYEQIPEVRAAA